MCHLWKISTEYLQKRKSWLEAGFASLTYTGQVNLTLASVAVRERSERFDGLAAEYLDRVQNYIHADAEVFRTSAAFFDWVDRVKGRTAPVLVLLDQRG